MTKEELKKTADEIVPKERASRYHEKIVFRKDGTVVWTYDSDGKRYGNFIEEDGLLFIRWNGKR